LAAAPYKRPRQTGDGIELPRSADGRTLACRRFRSLCDAFAAEFGGQLTEVDRSLIAQAAGLTLRAEQLQTAIVRGEDVSNDELVRISSTAKRLLEANLTRCAIVDAAQTRTPTTSPSDAYRLRFRAWRDLKAFAGLERAKRSGSEFRFEFAYAYPYLRTSVDFCVGRFVGRFIGRRDPYPAQRGWSWHRGIMLIGAGRGRRQHDKSMIHLTLEGSKFASRLTLSGFSGSRPKSDIKGTRFQPYHFAASQGESRRGLPCST
jgi:hypothetical protein